MLGTKEISTSEEGDTSTRKLDYPVYKRDSGIRCSNPRCVSIQETEIKYLKPEFKIVDHNPLTLRCIYCEHGFEPKYIASSDWHEGTLATKKYHRADSHLTRKIKPENLIIFGSESEAEAQGFKPDAKTSHRNKEEGKKQ